MKSIGTKMRLITGNGTNSQKNGGMVMSYTVNYYLLFNDGEMRSFEEKSLSIRLMPTSLM